jgi:hypothetical protein
MEDFLSSDLLQWLQGDSTDIEGDTVDPEQELYIDSLLLQASHAYDIETGNSSLITPSSAVPTASPPSHTLTMSPTPGPSCSRPFAPPKTEKEIEAARKSAVSKETRQDTDYCIRWWNEWRVHRQIAAHVSIPPITEQSQTELQHWMLCFMLEVRKKDGSEFPANSLHHVVCGIMCYLRWNDKPGLDFFKDADFDKFRCSLAEMKCLQSNGVGSKRRQAEPTEEEEEILRQKGLLGDSNP